VPVFFFYIFTETLNLLDMEFEIEYGLRANVWRRLANRVIDLGVYYIFMILIGVFIGLLTHVGIYAPYEYIITMNRIQESLLCSGIGFIYYFTFETFTDGRTIGKYITNTKVLTWYGEKPSPGRIAKRSLCRMIPFNAFSFLTQNPLGWHDSISSTVVVDIKKYNQELYLKQSFHEIGTAAE
jgi:uncharacterized RDD family membrane protein YckC